MQNVTQIMKAKFRGRIACYGQTSNTTILYQEIIDERIVKLCTDPLKNKLGRIIYTHELFVG